MRIGVVGINYKSSELALREQIAKASGYLFRASSDAFVAFPYILLSTCNRTEIYFCADCMTDAHSEILGLLRTHISLPFEHALYSYFGEECFVHLVAVTTGLDSLILGETEIQRQVKISYENARIARTLPACMHFVFQKCFKLSKELRSTSSLSQGEGNLERMIFRLSSHLLKPVEKKSFLFIGNSEINRKIITYFKRKELKDITLCTRSLHGAKEFAEEWELRLVNWTELPRWQDYAGIVCGTNYPDFLLAPEEVDLNLKTQLIFDLSLPRNVDPRLARHPRITLLNTEELGKMLEKERRSYSLERECLEEQIRLEVEKQVLLFRQREELACATS